MENYLGPDGQWSVLHSYNTTNILFADGSVRHFAERTSPEVIQALATIAGGEKVEPEE